MPIIPSLLCHFALAVMWPPLHWQNSQARAPWLYSRVYNICPSIGITLISRWESNLHIREKMTNRKEGSIIAMLAHGGGGEGFYYDNKMSGRLYYFLVPWWCRLQIGKSYILLNTASISSTNYSSQSSNNTAVAKCLVYTCSLANNYLLQLSTNYVVKPHPLSSLGWYII